MSEVIALEGYARDARGAADGRIAWLAETILRNRFMPVPPEGNIFVGDGDFRLIGAEFLRHFVEIGGLRPHDRVLDVGSGIGRMAVPLTQYLDPDEATYDGFDPVKEGVDWCVATITPAYPNFRFRHLDIGHELYNPDGDLAGDQLALPFDDATFDFVIMVSVATHLPPPEVEAYAREIARVLAPAGRLFMTAFVMDETALASREARDSRLDFAPGADRRAWHADPQAPLGAVAFEDGFIDGVLGAAGLSILRKSLGHWRGAPAVHYQDIFIAEKAGAPA